MSKRYACRAESFLTELVVQFVGKDHDKLVFFTLNVWSKRVVQKAENRILGIKIWKLPNERVAKLLAGNTLFVLLNCVLPYCQTPTSKRNSLTYICSKLIATRCLRMPSIRLQFTITIYINK